MASVKMPGLKKFASRLKSIEKSLSNTRQLHGETVVLYERWVKLNFIAQGKDHDKSSLHWKPLSETTKALRSKGRRTGSNPKILQDTGQLRQRWTRIFNEKEARFKSAQNYSSLHERGGTSKLGGKTFKVPQRKIFPVKKQGIKIIKPAVKRYMKRAFKR